MAWLLDTNVLSELRKPKPEARVVAFVSSLPLAEIYVSCVSLKSASALTVFPILPDVRNYNNWLVNEVRPMFDRRILELTEDVLLKWRELVEQGRKIGHTFSQPDLMIAATAIHHHLTVVTRDRRHYDKAGVPVIDPWLAP